MPLPSSVIWKASFPMSKSLLQNEEVGKDPACSHLSSRLNSQHCTGFSHLTNRLLSAWLSSLPTPWSPGPTIQCCRQKEHSRTKVQPAWGAGGHQLASSLTALNCQSRGVIPPAFPPTSLANDAPPTAPQLCSAWAPEYVHRPQYGQKNNAFHTNRPALKLLQDTLQTCLYGQEGEKEWTRRPGTWAVIGFSTLLTV